MPKETNIEHVKEISKALLHLDFGLTPMSPMLVHHPYTQYGITGIPNKEKGLRMVNLVESKDDLKAWQENIEKAIDKCETAIEIAAMITPNYTFGFLKFVKNDLSKADLSKILASAWAGIENANMDNNLSKAQLVSLFKKADKKILMDEDEYKAYNKLPEIVSVYRGVTEFNAKNIKALSWTLSKDRASFFARRFNGKGKIYSAKIEKQHILAAFEFEREVIVVFKYLQDIEVYRDYSK